MLPKLKLAHLVTHVRSLGGMNAMVLRHWKVDAQWGFQTRVITLFERGGPPMERVTDLELTWRNSIRDARRRIAPALAASPLDATIYHNLWGLPFFAELDPASRRIGLLHSDWPGLESLMPHHQGLMDGLMCVCEPLVQLARRTLPDLDEDRIALLPSPVDAPATMAAHAPLAGRPLIIGCCGRVSKAQKRVDRLPALCDALDQAGLSFRLELLGDGPERPWLERQLGSRNNVQFHGQLKGDAYWQTLGKWDVILFVSDFEGLPLALLEGMCQGALPAYPRIASGGDPYAARIHPDCLYSPGDFHALAHFLKELTAWPPGDVTKLRQKCREAILPHLGDSYQRAFSEFVRKIHALPRHSIRPISPRPFFWLDLCPFGLLRRAFYRHFFTPNAWPSRHIHRK